MTKSTVERLAEAGYVPLASASFVFMDTRLDRVIAFLTGRMFMRLYLWRCAPWITFESMTPDEFTDALEGRSK